MKHKNSIFNIDFETEFVCGQLAQKRVGTKALLTISMCCCSKGKTNFHCTSFRNFRQSKCHTNSGMQNSMFIITKKFNC